ncbi:SAM-dependent methyltransferase [Paracoccus beibuensis]|uniref:SAM-dependent methyltransferase n=1 Tax=Paracoccus beibuensis TaxID=547602 RepID=UPI00223FC2A1|nr:SAM-dependent methyltransferase [Paracoccus beibuensis]
MPREDTLRHLSSLYSQSDDPWDHRTSPYEQAKYDATLDAIGHGPFHDALEIGCGNGTLLARLAPRCRSLTGLDCIPAAVALARQAVATHPHVTVLEACVPDDLPDGHFDLVVLSEVLYFLTLPDIGRLAAWLQARTSRLVCVNWLGDTGESLDGNDAIAALQQALTCTFGSVEHERYRIDVLGCKPASRH